MNDIVFIQHLINTNISIDQIIDILSLHKCNIYLSIHDFHWLSNDSDPAIGYLSPEFDIKKSLNYNKIKILFSLVDIIIHPSKFTYNIYNKYYSNNNFKIIDHNDYKVNNDSIYIPPIYNNTINIGNLSGFCECKGKEYLLLLMSKYKIYKNYNINFVIIGYNSPVYNETEYYEYVKKYNIHGLTYLNKWGETWCYSLTKALNTGLPIIYNNIGAFKERITNKKQYFKAFDYENDDMLKIYNTFNNLLDYIIQNNGKYNNFYNNDIIIYNPFYDSIFN